MTETLGSYIQYIPLHDQEVIAKAMTLKRHQSIHRGMIALLPIDEIIDALRNYSSYYTNYMQQQAYQQYQQRLQQQVLQQSPLGGFSPIGGGNFGPPPIKYEEDLTLSPHYAYCALLVARGFMKRDQKDNEKNVEDDETK